MHLLVLLHPCTVFCCCCCCCSVLYLLCISLSEGQLGRHMEHDLLLSMQGVDRLGTSLTMWHIQTSSKTARGRREQSKLANPPGLKILKHRRPFFDRNIDNREWMCIFLLVGTTRGISLTPWSLAAPPSLPTAAGSPGNQAFLHCYWTALLQTPGEQVRDGFYIVI